MSLRSFIFLLVWKCGKPSALQHNAAIASLGIQKNLLVPVSCLGFMMAERYELHDSDSDEPLEVISAIQIVDFLMEAVQRDDSVSAVMYSVLLILWNCCCCSYRLIH